MNELTFQAEVKETNAKKTASNDVTYKVVLYTDNPAVLALGALPGETMLNVTIKAEE